MSFRKDQFFKENGVSNIHVSGIELSNYSDSELRKLWRDTLHEGIHGLCFSMYEDGQEPGDKITKEQVERRIEIIKPYTKWVRSFSCIEGNEFVPEMAHKHGLKTMVGAWLSDDLDKNEEEIKALIKLTKEGLVDIAAVGNEVLYRNDLTLEQLIAYMQRVKAAVPHTIVGYVDAYYEFSVHPELIENSDVILSNCYPYWEGTSIGYANSHMKAMFDQTLIAAARHGKKVIITETGWPSRGESLKIADASEVNAMKYFIDTQRWSKANGIELFYFSSFDESWKKDDEGEVGAFWGIWDKNESMKF
ncbi:glycosyl hydrolase family 17 protein [Nonlabens ulvanivorans]|uniref:glycoside hydrolase family 17 protein n=1 Tax=Nonlabens ulvanivorans TaxID=906888 RepID=UPI0037CAA2C8